MKEFKNLKRVVIEELEKLDAQYASKSEFTQADAERYRCLMSGLTKQLTAEAMMEAEEYEGGYSGEDGGMSGRRGRSPSTGRYVSRDGGMSYADGYSHGYSEAMRQQSGHWPGEMPPYDFRVRY